MEQSRMHARPLLWGRTPPQQGIGPSRVWGLAPYHGRVYRAYRLRFVTNYPHTREVAKFAVAGPFLAQHANSLTPRQASRGGRTPASGPSPEPGTHHRAHAAWTWVERRTAPCRSVGGGGHPCSRSLGRDLVPEAAVLHHHSQGRPKRSQTPSPLVQHAQRQGPREPAPACFTVG